MRKGLRSDDMSQPRSISSRLTHLQRSPPEVRTITRSRLPANNPAPSTTRQLFSRSRHDEVLQKFRASLSSDSEPEPEAEQPAHKSSVKQHVHVKDSSAKPDVLNEALGEEGKLVD